MPHTPGQVGAIQPATPQNSSQWVDLISNLIRHVESTSDRIAIMEQCKTALQEEAGDPRLWRLYGDWVWLLYKISHNVNDVYPSCSIDEEEVQQPWSQEDAVIGQVVFQWAGMIDVWRQGAKATSWHIYESHTVWDPYLELLLHDLSTSPSPDKVASIKSMFSERLRIPHATWEQTFQVFSTFVSTYDQDNWMNIMQDTKDKTQRARQEYELRESREDSLARASRQGDEEAEKTGMLDYLEWEEGQQRNKGGKKKVAPFVRDLYNGLCERATLRFPTHPDFWLDRIVALMQRPEESEALISVAERATMHCPGSGELWQKRLYALEACEKDFAEISAVKHTATSTGLLEDMGSMQELILVEFAWCSYLRRRAFSATATEEDLDVAEVALRSAIENVWTVGHRKYGNAFKGDPEFRMERIYLKFLSQAGRLDQARAQFRKLEATHGDSHYFWERWYLFEMTIYDGRFDQMSKASPQFLPPPKHATEALLRAVKRPNLDYPEKVIDMYLHHCAQHETARKLLEAQVETRRVLKAVAKKREKQYAEAAAAQQLALLSQTPGPSDYQQEASDATAKRKRETEVHGDSTSKRARRDSINEVPQTGDASSSAKSQLKRDRENTTVIIRHLPHTATDASIARFFRDCGEILSTTIVRSEDESTATIEFASQEDVLTAQTKSMRAFEGKAVEIQVGTSTTLFVSNYPPSADENYIRGLFNQYGEVVEIRFPSLKFNSHRRFCYVQFIASAQAQAATQMDGKTVEKGLVLTAKLSNPGAKKNRTGALEEGREVYVSNVDWSAREADIKELFASYGTVEDVRIPTNMKGKSKGTAFIIFSTKDEAQAALDMHMKDYKDRILRVVIAESKTKGQTTTIVDRNGSPAASAASPSEDASMPDASLPDASPTPAADQAPPATTTNSQTQAHHTQRTLALLDLPDTLNDARIRAICEPYGPLRKIILRPDHGGALVEFENVADAGRASIAINGTSVADGVNIRVGSAKELFASAPFIRGGADIGIKKPETKSKESKSAIAANNDFNSTSTSTGFPAPQKPVARPGQSGKRRGGRGGLGFKAAAAPSHTQATECATANGDTTATPEAGHSKTQSDFRALISASSGATNGAPASTTTTSPTPSHNGHNNDNDTPANTHNAPPLTTKFWAVRNGRQPGVYSDWEAASVQVKGFSKAVYKSFGSEGDAEAFVRGEAVVGGKKRRGGDGEGRGGDVGMCG